MVGLLSDIGNMRKLNEDYLGYFQDDNKRFYIIADGMGGHNAGEVASKMAVETILDYINSINDIEDGTAILKDAITIANEKIYKLSQGSGELNGMGTTITIGLIIKDSFFVANVGDSSLYAVKEDGIVKITKDHSLVQQLIDSGSITEEEAKIHPNKNIITRALGTHEVVEVDTFNVDLQGVVKIIMCTDGLSNEVDINEMYDIVLKNENDVSCKRLIELSKQKGGRDNISVIIFEGV
jgi:serine/threonine protein phosphatase PrpC